MIMSSRRDDLGILLLLFYFILNPELQYPLFIMEIMLRCKKVLSRNGHIVGTRKMSFYFPFLPLTISLPTYRPLMSFLFIQSITRRTDLQNTFTFNRAPEVINQNRSLLHYQGALTICRTQTGVFWWIIKAGLDYLILTVRSAATCIIQFGFV